MESQIFAEFSGKDNLPLPMLCQNLFNSQKKSWPRLTQACLELASVRTREISCDSYKVFLQYNPQRAVSSGAAVDEESIKKRPCFLCATNRPLEQHGILYRKKYVILCNPAPIFDKHFTVVTLKHQPQEIASSLTWLLQLAADASPDYTVSYNGPACGASAPDHLHFQIVPSDALPFLNSVGELPPRKEISFVRFYHGENLDRSILMMESKSAEALMEQFLHLMKTAQKILSANNEPLMNILCSYANNTWRLIIFLRQKHRPAAYFAAENERLFISPGAIDMAGVIITPLLKDYDCLTAADVRNIYREVSLDEEALNTIIKAL